MKPFNGGRKPDAVARTLAVMLLSSMLGCGFSPTLPTLSTQSERTSATAGVKPAATIERTAFGIAHISAGNLESLAYGIAYAHAEDNVCQTADLCDRAW